MSDGDAVRKLLLAQSAERSAFIPAAIAAGVYVAIGFGVYGFVAITWDDPPGPVFFLLMFDVLFVLLALGGLTFRSDAEPGHSGLLEFRTLMIASGGAWQAIIGLVKGVLFLLPYSAFDAIRSVLPPLGAADDAETLKVLRRLSVLKGGVPLELFRYLCGNPSSSSFRLALEAAEYLDAGHVRGKGDETKIVPGLEIAKLAAAMNAGQKQQGSATRPGTTRVPTQAGTTTLPPN